MKNTVPTILAIVAIAFFYWFGARPFYQEWQDEQKQKQYQQEQLAEEAEAKKAAEATNPDYYKLTRQEVAGMKAAIEKKLSSLEQEDSSGSPREFYLYKENELMIEMGELVINKGNLNNFTKPFLTWERSMYDLEDESGEKYVINIFSQDESYYSYGYVVESSDIDGSTKAVKRDGLFSLFALDAANDFESFQ
ncbi:MAG: hypothetical protein PHC89_01305 [Candidatus Pacebacteria bacterium]|nr:hypothetical protein [Candidatus Paceibacterota bacterium]